MPPRLVVLARLALALCASGCGDLADTVEEAAEIAGSGGAERLRDPLRPPAGPPRVLVFGLDGVGHEALRSALDEGRLPTLAALLGAPTDASTFAHGADLGPMLAVFPSITVAAWTALFTGATPAVTGVPGNEWFARESGTFHAPAPVSVESRRDALATLSDHLLDSLVSAPTVFERADVRTYVSLLPLHRGADVLAMPGTGDFLELLAAFPAGAAEGSVDRDLYATVDRTSAERMAELVADEGPPDLGVVYFPGIDLYSHATPSPLEEQQRYLAEVTDSAIARVLAAYREAGALDGTFVIVTGDHGHTPVPFDDVHALGGDSAFSARAVLDEAGFRVRPATLDPEDEDHQAVIAWQGALAYVYLADRSGCPAEGTPCAWARPPRWDEDVLAAARALEAAAGERRSPPLDLVLLRRDAADGEGSELFVLDGGRPIALDAYLDAHPQPELIRFRERLDWLTSGPHRDRAGDVMLLARLGASLPHDERHYFSKPYRSWHATAEAQDSYAPLVLARVDLSGEEIRGLAAARTAEPTQLDFTPLMLRLLRGSGGRR